EDEEWWQAASAMGRASAYEAYLSKFPTGRYAGLARDRLATARHAESAMARAEEPDPSGGPVASSGSSAPQARPSEPRSSPSAPPSQIAAAAPSAPPGPATAGRASASGAQGSLETAQRAAPPAPDTQVAAIPPSSSGLPDPGPPRAT